MSGHEDSELYASCQSTGGVSGFSCDRYVGCGRQITSGSAAVAAPTPLTWAGHNFLANAKNDKLFESGQDIEQLASVSKSPQWEFGVDGNQPSNSNHRIDGLTALKRVLKCEVPRRQNLS